MTPPAVTVTEGVRIVGEAKRRRVAGLVFDRARTGVAVRFGDAVFRAEMDPAHVDEMLRGPDEMGGGAEVRDLARRWVVDTLHSGAHLTGDRDILARTVLWLLCRDPAHGPALLAMARKGGFVLAYVVEETAPLVLEWRAVAVDLGAGDASPVDFATEGNA